MDQPCTCPLAGYCERFGLTQQPHVWEICRGLHGEAVGRRYREKWARRKAGVATPRRERAARKPAATAAPPAATAPAKPKDPPAPKDGPGAELKALLSSLGVTGGAGCGCDRFVRQMNRWGAEGCREHREEILAQLRAAQQKLGWLAKLKAAALAAAGGLAFRLDATDPAPGLLEEALRRWEARAGDALPD